MEPTDLATQVRQLQAVLAAREQEVAALREVAEAAAELQSQDVQAAKVIELSRKNRAINLQLEKERTKVAKLTQALSEASAAQAQHGGAQPADNEQRASKEAAAASQQQLRERLQQLTNRLAQMEQKVFLLEGENRRMVRALVREVGEDVPLQRVLQDDPAASDWRGRREQIVALRHTVQQLRAQLAAAGGSNNGSGDGAAAQQQGGKHETAHRSVIGKLNKQKDAELARMAAELEAAKGAAEQLRLQFTGASSRRKVLEAEVAGLRDKLGVVLGKTANDDKLIAALRAELVAVAGGNRPVMAGEHSGSSLAAPSFELSQQRCSQLEEQVEQQAKIIRILQAQLKGLKSSSSGQHQQQQAVLQQRQPNAPPAQRPGSGGASAALRQQVLTLQQDNAELQAQLEAATSSMAALSSGGGRAASGVQRAPAAAAIVSRAPLLNSQQHLLSLTSTDMAVLEAAKEALAGGGSTGGPDGDEEDQPGGDEGSGGGYGSDEPLDYGRQEGGEDEA